MRRLQRLWMWLSAIAIAVVTAPHAHACTCRLPPPPLEAAAEADVVFIGTALKITEERDPGDGRFVQKVKRYFDLKVDHGYWLYAVEFDVSTTIKGEAANRIVVRTNTTSPACGFSFREAVAYLVYAYSHEGKIYTSICTRTTPIEGAEDEVQELLNDGRQPSNDRVQPTVRPVTPLAYASGAPGRPTN